MRKHYLHLGVYRCDKCDGPVITGSFAVKENEISKETDIREIGASCLSCGRAQSNTNERFFTAQFPPIEWQPTKAHRFSEGTARLELERVSRD